jgi:uncharacterized protein YpmS
MEKKKNVWKYAFFGLLAANVLIGCGIFLLIFLVSDEKTAPPNATMDRNHSELIVTTHKRDLNKLINRYIEKEGLNGPIHYDVYLTDLVELYGEVSVFSRPLQLKMTFEPKALDNGDLILEQKDVSLGDVQLPVPYILKFMKDAYKFPSWVIIQPNDKQVYVALQHMRLNNGIRVRLEEFNLEQDRISLRMLVPAD